VVLYKHWHSFGPEIVNASWVKSLKMLVGYKIPVSLLNWHKLLESGAHSLFIRVTPFCLVESVVIQFPLFPLIFRLTADFHCLESLTVVFSF